MKPNFSVCLIAKNEEKTLPRMLKSLEKFLKIGGEVLLLDTGSTDKTVEVAKKAGVKVYEVGDKFLHVHSKEVIEAVNKKLVVAPDKPIMKEGDKNFNFAAARNHLASLATHDMIAMPDCDEQFSVLDLHKIIQMIDEGVEQFVYPFTFSHDAYGKPAIQFYHSKFYNRKKLFWTGVVHEVLQTKEGISEVNSKTLDGSVIYLEHFQNAETNRSQYLTGLAYDVYLHPDHDRNSHYLGRELLYTHRFHSAIKELTRHINLQKWDTERSESALFIGDAKLWLGKPHEALQYYHYGYILDSSRREPFMRLAEYFYQHKDPARVIAYCEAALTIPTNNFYANNQNLYTKQPHEYLYWAYWQMGDKTKSREHFFKCINYEPQNKKYLEDKKWYEEA